MRTGDWKVDRRHPPFTQGSPELYCKLHINPDSPGLDSRYTPSYLKLLKDAHTEELYPYKGLLQEVRDQPRQNVEVEPSFGKYLIERQTELELDDNETACLTGSMFGARSGTPSDPSCIESAAERKSHIASSRIW
ncbi:hypothetical protein EDD18DRAFT_1186360 [Armillaria luteobubalina]|uniref:Uncharacterized protein n=1 Tax=Armillaria luteobubalina TaxID=153913 RepID=A0AA39PY70_9AGAR|nr:hypothetical protein EDD18DRAFT_1186360 [Armillaria luteobubalina]